MTSSILSFTGLCYTDTGVGVLVVNIAQNVKVVRENIRRAAEQSGRDPGQVKLLAATKTQGVPQVRAALEAGVRYFGENYVQEAKGKREALGPLGEWHLIGHLQKNKVSAAVDLFSMIQSLDSVELAKRLDRAGAKQDVVVRVLVEVNLAGEETKSGVSEAQLLTLLRETARLPNMSVEGLMIIPPFAEDPEASRSYFRKLRDLRDSLRQQDFPNLDLKELSMGMTHDYAIAVEEGSTMVRVGTALFGPRAT